MTDSTALVERVARAIAGNHGYDFDRIGEAERNAWREDARAALDASGEDELRAEVERLREAERRATTAYYRQKERLREVLEAEQRNWFCSGSDCDSFDYGRDEGLKLALDAFDAAPPALEPPAAIARTQERS